MKRAVIDILFHGLFSLVVVFLNLYFTLVVKYVLHMLHSNQWPVPLKNTFYSYKGTLYDTTYSGI